MKAAPGGPVRGLIRSNPTVPSMVDRVVRSNGSQPGPVWTWIWAFTFQGRSYHYHSTHTARLTHVTRAHPQPGSRREEWRRPRVEARPQPRRSPRWRSASSIIQMVRLVVFFSGVQARVLSKPVAYASTPPHTHLPIPIRPPGLNANFLVEDEDALKVKYGGAFTRDRD